MFGGEYGNKKQCKKNGYPEPLVGQQKEGADIGHQ